MLGKSPDSIPEGLDPEDYLELGRWFKEDKKLDLARAALEKVLELEPDGENGRRARTYMEQHVPGGGVPQEVVDRCSQHMFMITTDPRKAEKAFKTMIQDHPQFDWPYRGLGQIYLGFGDLERSIENLDKALSISPKSTASLLIRAEVHLANMNYSAARIDLDATRGLEPGNENESALRRTLETLEAFE